MVKNLGSARIPCRTPALETTHGGHPEGGFGRGLQGQVGLQPVHCPPCLLDSIHCPDLTFTSLNLSRAGCESRRRCSLSVLRLPLVCVPGSPGQPKRPFPPWASETPVLQCVWVECARQQRTGKEVCGRSRSGRTHLSGVGSFLCRRRACCPGIWWIRPLSAPRTSRPACAPAL